MMAYLHRKWKTLIVVVSIALILLLVLNSFLFGTSAHTKHYISDCSIYDEKGQLIKSFSSGVSCLFLNDGSYIMHDENKLQRISNNGKVLWQNLGEYHHQLKWLKDRNHFIALANDSKNYKDRSIRYTQIEIWSIEGVLKSSYSLKDNLNTFFNAIETSLELSKPFDGPYQSEYEHINAVHEIPDSPLKTKNPLFNSENLLVSVNEREVLAFIDKNDLSPKGFLRLPKEFINFHDAQVLSGGRLLLYLNQDKSDNPRIIVEWNPDLNSWKTLVYHQQVQSDQPEIFGGLQETSEKEVLFNVRSKGKWKLYKLDSKNNLNEIKNDNSNWAYAQQIKSEDVSQFLLKNISL